VRHHFADQCVTPNCPMNRTLGKSCPPASGRGFSLLELMIVVSIVLIAAAMAVLSVKSALRSVRLFESGTDYANLLQNARIRAVKDDRFYTVRTTIPSTGPAQAYVDLAGTGVYAAGDPVMEFPQAVAPMPFASGPSLTNLEAMFLPSGNNALATVNTTAAGPTFSSRGLPCNPTVGAGGSITCISTTPTSHIVFMQNQQSGQWMAITVTPAGRIRQWQYDGSANWSPRN
jgi:prepilin-type N-terminal cleavage/methylation domain-containing protein